MRLKTLLITVYLGTVALITVSQSSPSPDFDATATALVVHASETAAAQGEGTRRFITPAEFQLTATEMAADSLATTEAAANEFEAQSLELTPSSEDSSNFEEETSPLILAIFVFVGVIGGLIILSILFVVLARREAKRDK